ncbi:MAG: universal stress protein [bacterium]|nr:universal stress protein [bacterium]MDT8395343.1 universal stress protein [bacterium]
MKFNKVQKFLVPVDFSTTSNKAFAYARELVKRCGGELHLLHVLDTEFLTGAVHITIEPLEESVGKWRKRAQEKLAVVYHGEGETRLPGKIHLREGKPHEEILKAAEDLGVDMIIIGSHGRHGIERAIFGSVAERVVKNAPIPVLVIK